MQQQLLPALRTQVSLHCQSLLLRPGHLHLIYIADRASYLPYDAAAALKPGLELWIQPLVQPLWVFLLQLLLDGCFSRLLRVLLAAGWRWRPPALCL